MTEREKTLVTLAAKMGLTPYETIALPESVTVASGKARMSETAFVREMMTNAPLRDYVASVIRNVMANLPV